MHVFHGCVRDIDLLDESLTLSIECLEDDSNCTEHISVEKGTQDKDA